jgi:hypothetical protein
MIGQDENAGTALAVYEETRWEKAKRKVSEFPLFARLSMFRQRMEDSDNPLVQRTLDVQDSILETTRKVYDDQRPAVEPYSTTLL